MKISLLTDAPKHNLALMKLSAWHKSKGDQVLLNMPICRADYTYASVLFERNKKSFFADEYGGPAYEIQDNKSRISTNKFFSDRGKRRNIKNPNKNRVSKLLKKEVQNIFPDYGLYSLGFSLGYTFYPCMRKCSFCKVPKMLHPDKNHHSIWEFHDPKFKKICLLNNNTFFDPQWKETFEEIWDADLSVIDENGYDLRLLDDEKAEALKKTKWCGKLHFAWDRIEDESKIIRGVEILNRHKINNTHIYVLIGFDTTQEQDFHRCQKLIDYGHDPYVMPYNQSRSEKQFKRFIDSFMWRKYKTIKAAWENYK